MKYTIPENYNEVNSSKHTSFVSDDDTKMRFECNYAPNFEKIDGAYCFWSVRAWVGGCVRAWVRHTFEPTVTFKPLKLES